MKITEASPFGCKCQTLSHRLTGDGCEICNPELHTELMAELEEEDDRRRDHICTQCEDSESRWADHYHSKLVEAQEKGYLPEGFSF